MQENIYDYEKIKEDLRQQIYGLAENKADKICIFGAGRRGLKLYKELYARFINIDYFCDNNQSIISSKIDDVEIISFNELVKYKDNILVIISAVDYVNIEKQLIDNEFPYIFTMNKIKEMYIDIPPIKWLEEFDGKVDFTDATVVELIKRFQKVILDICCYYENIEE